MINFSLKERLIKKAKEKTFDMKVTSGAIAVADHGGNFRFEHHDILKESLDDKYFKKKIFFKIIILLDYLNLNMVLKLNQRFIVCNFIYP